MLMQLEALQNRIDELENHSAICENEGSSRKLVEQQLRDTIQQQQEQIEAEAQASKAAEDEVQNLREELHQQMESEEQAKNEITEEKTRTEHRIQVSFIVCVV